MQIPTFVAGQITDPPDGKFNHPGKSSASALTVLKRGPPYVCPVRVQGLEQRLGVGWSRQREGRN